MEFKELNIIEPILRSLHEEGYSTPTPVQEQAIPIVLQGTDLLGCAQTGTGKTAAFAIPILQLLGSGHTNEKRRKIRSLIVTPTRELAIQIDESFKAYGRHTGLISTVVFGGVGLFAVSHKRCDDPLERLEEVARHSADRRGGQVALILDALCQVVNRIPCAIKASA